MGNLPSDSSEPPLTSEEELLQQQESPLLLDALAASSAIKEIDQLPQREIASDSSLSTLERIEALEEFVDSEVGDTELVRLRHIEREYGLRQLYLKYEGSNPTGTQKDRISFRQVLDAIRRGYEVVTFASCGNYGVAVAFAAAIAGVRCVVHMPSSSHSQRIKEITSYGAEVVFVDGDYEQAVAESSERAIREEFYDANPGGENTVLQLSAYAEIAEEIYDELRDAPRYVAVPVSNGTTLAGIYRGFVRLYRRGKTSKVPKMIGSSSFGKNPIVRSFLRGSDVCMDLSADRIKETAINEPLINWHSFDGDLALEAIRESKGCARHASDRSMVKTAKLIRDKDGFQVLPASAAGLCSLLDLHRESPLPADRYVVVITGKK